MNKTRILGFVLSFGLVVLVGCGKPKTGTVKGKITFENKALAGATVTFWVEGQTPIVATTDEQGFYQADNVAVGAVGVSVVPASAAADGETLKRLAKDGVTMAPPVPKKNKPVVPATYADPLTSGLTHTVTEGESTYDIPLKK